MSERATKPFVEPLRSESIAVEPLHIERVFDDPERVIERIEARAPLPTLSKYHGFGTDSLYGRFVLPWFRTHLDDDLVLQNPSWIEGARQAFGAKVVKPIRCIVNANPPAPEGAVHVDLPTFRGSQRWGGHVWLLMSMSHSGLFAPWMVPMASGLAWFYRGVGGEFEYWPDGPEAPPRRESAPLWNVGQISDNEYMWHRVRAIGRPEEIGATPALRAEATLHATGGGVWEVRDGDDVQARYELDQLRISLLWKAYVFPDERKLASFENHDADLDLEQVTDVFCRDLARRGVPFQRPSDPLRDPAWQKVIVETYPPAFRV